MIGETLGRKYKVAGLLGRGGMGAVYAADDQEAQRRVAVKVLHAPPSEGSEGLRRFQREAEAALAIHDEHIVRVLDTGTDEATGQLYLVTEHLDGEDLQRLLDRVGTLSVDGALHIAAQALAGLAAAHEARVVHRDIKPANIFLAAGGGGALTVKLLDFGIAKLRTDPLAATADLTTTGVFLGSPLYMSPEQVQNSRDVDHRTDLWSMGCVLYAMLAGRAPQQHLTTIGQLLVATCTSPAPALSEVAPWVPAEVADVVHRALSIAPEGRYSSAGEMLAAIRELSSAGPLSLEMIAESGERVVPNAGSRGRGEVPRAAASEPAGAAYTPRIVVGRNSDVPIRGDEATEHQRRSFTTSEERAAEERAAAERGGSTLRSGAHVEGPAIARSGVPAVGAKAGAHSITVDPRRLLGRESELWTFSLEVHRHLGSLLARIWKSLRRAGAKVPPMSYGVAWSLVEPRTGRVITDAAPGEEPPSLEDAGIRPGTVLWVVAPEPEAPGSAPVSPV